MRFCRGCNERIHRMNGPSQRFVSRDQAAPFVGYCAVYRQDPLLKPQWQITSQPFIKLLATLAYRQALDTVTQLRECDDA